jgi:CubicO group peptidase (beta-lactamase class C family)
MPSSADIDRILLQACESGAIPGAVAMAATDNEVIYQGAFGRRDISKNPAMTADSVFWIASMTKAITATAAMQLVERGKLSLDAPIGEILPDLSAIQVLDGFNHDGEPLLRPARRPITLRQLLTHTAGFCYDMMNADMGRWLEKTGTPVFRTGLNAAMRVPIMTDPGTRWEYGTNIDFVGKAVEAASGQQLDLYFREHILEPLGRCTAPAAGESAPA